nr:S8 family peptidase [uncultured Methanospirillum sp.]
MGGVSQVSATLNADIQATVLADETTLGLSGIQLVKIPNDTTVDAAIQYYTNNSNVAYAQPDYIYQACNESDGAAVASIADNFSTYRGQRREPGVVSSNYSSPLVPSGVMRAALGNNTTTLSWPNDPYYSYQWDMVKMACPSAWAVSTGSSSVTVAVVDTGVDYNHPDLAANCVSGYDFYNDDSNPMDDNGHGTHCAGSVAAIGNNGVGIAGVTWNSKIMPLKFLNSGGGGYTSDAISAFAWGYAGGVRIFSNSWGGYGTDTALESAINTYSDAIFICAAGNGDDYGNPINIDSYPFSPAGLSCSNIVSVAATGTSDTLASWSNYGATTVDVAAPGVSIYSTLPSSSYGYKSGTSMATPHVAGLAALVKAVNSGYTAAQIKSAILSGVDTVSGLSGKCVTGGRVNATKGISQKMPIIGDWNGDGSDGVAIFRPSNGNWYYDDNRDGVTDLQLKWGKNGDIPLVGDWNGDGSDGVAIFRSSNGNWYYDTNRDGVTDLQLKWGKNGDIPLVGDWNGDGSDGVAIFRPSNGNWYYDDNRDGVTDQQLNWGLNGDIPLVGDWNGDESDGVAIFRSSNGNWYYDDNRDGVTDLQLKWGKSGDIPLVGDWNGDESEGVAIFRPSNGNWYYDDNRDGVTDLQLKWGKSGDIPLVGDWNGDGSDGVAIFRPSNGNWYYDDNRDGVTDLQLKWD